MNLARLLVRTAGMFGERPALLHGEELLCNYRELALRAARIGGFLQHHLGLAPGERVCLWMSNIPEYLELLYGAWFAGLVVVPINLKLHPKEVEYILQDSGAATLFVSADLAGAPGRWAAQPNLRGVFVPGTPEYHLIRSVEPLAEPLPRAWDDIAWLFYTSGTTGRPKGVMQTHGNLLTMISCYCIDVDAGVSPADGTVYAAPMSHAAGMLNFPHVIAGARHVVPRSGGFDPEELLRLAACHGRLTLFAAPTMVKRLVDQVEAGGADPSGFRTIVYGGGPMYVEDIRRALEVMGDRFSQIYGQGESPMTITALSRYHLCDRGHPRYLQRIASVGAAQSLVEVRVADTQGRPLPPGETGEVVVRGPSVMKGYWNNPEATAQTIRNGWLFSGDVGSMDEEGFLTLKDRSKDVIVSGGSNIYPREVEEVLLQHPQVQEVSVVGQRHDEWGEEVVAFVVTKNDVSVSSAELDALCLENIARFKRPKQYRFVPVLPKSSYGKVLKTALRKRLADE